MRFQAQYTELICTECGAMQRADRFRDGDRCPDKKCGGKLLGSDSTIVRHCPICVTKLSGDCRGDHEGCGAFKIRK